MSLRTSVTALTDSFAFLILNSEHWSSILVWCAVCCVFIYICVALCLLVSISPKLKSFEGLSVTRLCSDDLIKAAVWSESLQLSILYPSMVSVLHIYYK